MTTQVQFRRGTTAEHDTFTGAVGEVTVDTDLKTLKVHDGSNPGGTRIATFSNIAEQTHTFSDESSTSLTVTPGTSDIKLVGSGGISVVITGDTITTSLASELNADSISSANSTGVLINDNLIIAGNIQTAGSSEVVVENGMTVAGNISSETLDVNTISSNDSTEVVVDDGFRVTGTANIDTIEVNQLSSGDSTAIQINDGVNIGGDVTLGGTLAVDNIIGEDSTAVQISVLDVDTISSSGSTAVQVNEGLNVSGTLSADTIDTNTLVSTDSSVINIQDGLDIDGTLTLASGTGVNNILDEDDMSSNSDISLATQQSIKAYVDDQNTATALTQSLKISGDDSTNVDLIFALDTPATLHFEGGPSISTSTTSAGNVKISLAEELLVSKITSRDSTEITIDRLRTQAIIADDSGAVQVEDGMNIIGALNTTTLEIGDGPVITGVLDEDDMTSDSGVHLATQQSIKAFVDANAGATPQIGISGDDSVGVVFNATATNLIHFEGGNSITTSTASTRNVSFNLDSQIFVNEIAALDSTAVSIQNILQCDNNIQAVGTITAGDNITTSGSFVIGSASINETDLEKIDGITDGTAAGNKAVVLDANKDIGTIRNITSNGTVEFGSLTDGTITITAFADEDDFSSNSATLIPTQQSVKAFVDTQIANNAVLQIFGDDSTTMTVQLSSENLQVSGGNSITTSTSSTQVLTVALDESINVNSISSLDSTEVEILNIRTDTLVAHDSTQVTIRDALRVTGTITGTVTSAQYADLAEKYLADNTYPPGTVMVFGGTHEITNSTQSYDSKIAGIISTNPAFIMNNELEGGQDLGLTGRLPCRVKGQIQKGDMVTSSDTPGVAMKLDPTQYVLGCVIGKALENYDSQEEGVIEVVVGRL